jgi:hypothetical protein
MPFFADLKGEKPAPNGQITVQHEPGHIGLWKIFCRPCDPRKSDPKQTLAELN